MPPPKSKVWTYFKKLDTVIVKCKYCSQEVHYCGNISNLRKHLKKYPNVTNVTTKSANANAKSSTWF